MASVPVFTVQQRPPQFVVYLVVTKAGEPLTGEKPHGALYTRDAVRSVLQFIGCKPRHAYKVGASLFSKVTAALPDLARPVHRRAPGTKAWSVWHHTGGSAACGPASLSLYSTSTSTAPAAAAAVAAAATSATSELPRSTLQQAQLKRASGAAGSGVHSSEVDQAEGWGQPLSPKLSLRLHSQKTLSSGQLVSLLPNPQSGTPPATTHTPPAGQSPAAPMQLLPQGECEEVCVAMPRQDFNELLSTCLAEYKYRYLPGAEELRVGCSLRERRRCVVVLLSGTSGSGKSTLASILAGRLGITTVISTDSVRHMLRSFHPKEESPLLWASTYEAGELLEAQQAALAKQQQLAQVVGADNTPCVSSNTQPSKVAAAAAEPQSSQAPQGAPGPEAEQAAAVTWAVKGYKAQCEIVASHLAKLIGGFEASRESAVIEGVHLSISLVVKLMQRYPCCVPFLAYIKNEVKHTERMAVRAKYMTLDPQRNKYVAHMPAIRWIQDYLVRKADAHAIPKVENTNVDRSVGLIHLTLLGVLRRSLRGELLIEPGTAVARGLAAEFNLAADSLAAASTGVVAHVRAARQQQASSALQQADSTPSHTNLSAPGATTAAAAAADLFSVHSDLPPAAALPSAAPAVAPSAAAAAAAAHDHPSAASRDSYAHALPSQPLGPVHTDRPGRPRAPTQQLLFHQTSLGTGASDASPFARDSWSSQEGKERRCGTAHAAVAATRLLPAASPPAQAGSSFVPLESPHSPRTHRTNLHPASSTPRQRVRCSTPTVPTAPASAATPPGWDGSGVQGPGVSQQEAGRQLPGSCTPPSGGAGVRVGAQPDAADRHRGQHAGVQHGECVGGRPPDPSSPPTATSTLHLAHQHTHVPTPGDELRSVSSGAGIKNEGALSPIRGTSSPSGNAATGNDEGGDALTGTDALETVDDVARSLGRGDDHVVRTARGNVGTVGGGASLRATAGSTQIQGVAQPEHDTLAARSFQPSPEEPRVSTQPAPTLCGQPAPGALHPHAQHTPLSALRVDNPRRSSDPSRGAAAEEEEEVEGEGGSQHTDAWPARHTAAATAATPYPLLLTWSPTAPSLPAPASPTSPPRPGGRAPPPSTPPPVPSGSVGGAGGPVGRHSISQPVSPLASGSLHLRQSPRRAALPPLAMLRAPPPHFFGTPLPTVTSDEEDEAVLAAMTRQAGSRSHRTHSDSLARASTSPSLHAHYPHGGGWMPDRWFSRRAASRRAGSGQRHHRWQGSVGAWAGGSGGQNQAHTALLTGPSGMSGMSPFSTYAAAAGGMEEEGEEQQGGEGWAGGGAAGGGRGWSASGLQGGNSSASELDALHLHDYASYASLYHTESTVAVDDVDDMDLEWSGSRLAALGMQAQWQGAARRDSNSEGCEGGDRPSPASPEVGRSGGSSTGGAAGNLPAGVAAAIRRLPPNWLVPRREVRRQQQQQQQCQTLP